MTRVSATVEQAAQWAGETSVPAEWNPVYRALLEDAPASPPQDLPTEAELALVRRQLSSPALLVVAVTEGGRTRRLRLGLDPARGTVERSDGEEPSLWSELAEPEMPSAIAALLEECGLPVSAARLTTEREADQLRLTPAQNRIVRAELARGLAPADAYAAVPDLDERLRDALTAMGPQIALSLTLHDPQGRVTEWPVTWSRLWVQGELGRYRLDAPTTPGGAIQPVDDGDVLGTVLPILEEGLRFAAARAAAGDAR